MLRYLSSSDLAPPFREGIMLRSLLFVAAVLALLVTPALAASVEQWKGRQIYQLLTDRFARTDGSTQPCADLRQYCGGSFQGITDHLDYIAELGFDAIWISPVPQNQPGAYHGYASVFIYIMLRLHSSFLSPSLLFSPIDEYLIRLV
jgi:hypothetical protein